MPLQLSGPIYMSQIQAEFGGPNYYISSYFRGAGYVTANNLGVPAGGAIYFSQFYGAQRSVPGSWAAGSPGTYYFTVPVHSTITIDVRGAGGGGGGSTYDVGYPGSSGAYGESAYAHGVSLGASGGVGGDGSYYSQPGKAGNGSGSGGNYLNSYGDGAPGGVGGTYGFTKGGDGGDGGRAIGYWAAGSVGVGAVLTIVVPSGGGGGAGQVAGAQGSHGAVYISWT